jgi:5-methylcytosine-specific restriction endonuclease McrA
MANYTKLFNSIVTSTIWTEDDKTRIVWITMLAICDQNGEVQASIPGLARLSGVSVADAEMAIGKLLSPDKHSRTPDHEGRRIVPIEGGWELLNHAKYRRMASLEDRKEATAKRVKRHRERKTIRESGDDQGICAYCGDEANGVDHIIPKCKGGSDNQENLVRACARCNNFKASRDLVDFLNDHTLPFSLNVDGILSNAKLTRHVTHCNALKRFVTLLPDKAEAEAEADTNTEALELSKTKSNKARIVMYRPSIDAVRVFTRELGLPESDGEYMFHHWESNGWTKNGKPIKNWQAMIRSWKSAKYMPSQKTNARLSGGTQSTYADRNPKDSKEIYEIPEA